MDNQTLSLKNITKCFYEHDQAIPIFEHTSYNFSQNNSYALIGTSGVGKSTLLHMLAGIEQPSKGEIYLGATCVSKLPLQQKQSILAQSLGIVFQQPLLLQELSIIENVMLKKIITDSVTTHDEQYAYQLLSDINLVNKASSYPSELSGGQQQRIALLRALFIKPHFLLADEPTGNLDLATGKQIIKLLLQFKEKYNIGLIISTHDQDIASQMDHTLHIYNQTINI